MREGRGEERGECDELREGVDGTAMSITNTSTRNGAARSEATMPSYNSFFCNETLLVVGLIDSQYFNS